MARGLKTACDLEGLKIAWDLEMALGLTMAWDLETAWDLMIWRWHVV